jgi:hypothetical protein
VRAIAGSEEVARVQDEETRVPQEAGVVLMGRSIRRLIAGSVRVK